MYLTALGAALLACTICSFSFSRLHSNMKVVDGKVTVGMCLARGNPD
jgi:hypothetical protein